MEVFSENLKIKTPTRGIIAGPSNVGKTYFITRLLEQRNRLFLDNFERIIFCHPFGDFPNDSELTFFQKLENIAPGIEIRAQLPSLNDLQSINGKTLLILDDLIADIVCSAEYMRLFTIHSSHSQISIITTTQNFFEHGKFSKTILRNQNFFVLFDSKSDKQMTSIISRQLFPGKKGFLANCFAWLSKYVEKPEFRYVFIDCGVNNKLASFVPQVRINICKEIPEFDNVLFLQNIE